MIEVILRYVEVTSFFIAAIGAVYFGYRQTQINRRMKELQDYVAISIVPMGININSIKVMNVGKINLYLKQYIVGKNTEIFQNPLLIPAGTGENSNLHIILPNLQPVMPMKFYLIDELGKKYISTGQIMAEQLAPVLRQNVPQEGETITPQTIPNVNVINLKAWSFKTEKYNWII